jgi:uncharacterized protein YjbI with pentapeptide repeats
MNDYQKQQLLFGKQNISFKDQLDLAGLLNQKIKRLYQLRDQALITKKIQPVDKEIDFSKQDLSSLKDKDFFGLNLNNALFESSNLFQINFSRSDGLTASLQEAVFDLSNLEEVRFSFADLTRASFKKANLKKSSFVHSKLRRADLEESDLRGASFLGANLGEANLKGVLIDEETIFQRTLFKDAPFAVSSNSNLYFQKARFDSFIGRNLNFSGSDMKKIEVRDSSFKNCSFNKANLRKARFKKSKFLEAGFLFNMSALESANFYDCFLRQASFKKADLTKAVFRNCDLRDTNFNETDISQTQFINCQLEGSSLFNHKDFSESQLKNSTQSTFAPTFYDL